MCDRSPPALCWCLYCHHSHLHLHQAQNIFSVFVETLISSSFRILFLVSYSVLFLDYRDYRVQNQDTCEDLALFPSLCPSGYHGSLLVDSCLKRLTGVMHFKYIGTCVFWLILLCTSNLCLRAHAPFVLLISGPGTLTFGRAFCWILLWLERHFPWSNPLDFLKPLMVGSNWTACRCIPRTACGVLTD